MQSITLKPLHMALVQGLLNWEDKESDGWKSMKEIITSARSWKSQTTNFPKYIQHLIKLKIANSRIVKYNDERGRPHKRKEFRLRQDVRAFFLVRDNYVSFELNEMMKNRLGYTSKLKNDNDSDPFFSDYFEAVKAKTDLIKLLQEETEQQKKKQEAILEANNQVANHINNLLKKTNRGA